MKLLFPISHDLFKGLPEIDQDRAANGGEQVNCYVPVVQDGKGKVLQEIRFMAVEVSPSVYGWAVTEINEIN
jgi:hypothetical protein